ncbi:MAG: extracellular solute-binding protein [Anaerolineales bacterium]
MGSEPISRRKFLIASTATGLAAVLAACAPKEATTAPAAEAPTTAPAAEGPTTAPAAEEPTKQAEAPATTSKPAAGEPYTVRFLSGAGIDYRASFYKVLQEEFESNHPDIKVQVEPCPEGWEQKILTEMIAGTAPDVFEAWGNIFYNWVERDLLLDCQPYVDATMTQEEIADYTEFQWEGLFMRGKRVGMPSYINIVTLTCNVAAFDEYGVPLPPEDGEWDHDDYREMVGALTEAARSKGNNSICGGLIPCWEWYSLWNHIHMFGGKVVDQKYGKKCLLGEPEAQEGLKWLYDLEFVDNYNAQPEQVERKGGRQALNAGLIICNEDGTYPKTFDESAEGGPCEHWDLRHVPKGPTGIRSTLGTTDAWSIAKQSKNPDAAWTLVRFMSGPVYQAKAVVAEAGFIPALKSLQVGFIAKMRELRPNMNNVRLETITEVLDWGYAEDTPWFDKQAAAVDLIVPALEKVFMVGDVGPEYFIDIAKQVDAAQA